MATLINQMQQPPRPPNLLVITAVTATPESKSPVREVTKEQLSTLKKRLVLYKKKWVAFCMEKTIPNAIIKCLPYHAQASYWNFRIFTLSNALKMLM